MKKLLSFALALALCLGLAVPAMASANRFNDVPANSPYRDAIVWAVGQGITTGTSDTTFSPNNTCTTAHILAFLWRAAGRPGGDGVAMSWSQELALITKWAESKGMDLPADFGDPCTRASAVTYMWIAAGYPQPTTTHSFTDVPASISSAVSWAKEKGITDGTSASKFSPDNTCTRGQIVTFIYREKVAPLTSPSTPAASDDYVAQVIELVNQERVKAGLRTLGTDPNLTAATQVRTQEQAALFSHTRPNGSSCSTALTEAGVRWTAMGENIASGQRTPAEVMDSWMNSPGHRANILNPDYTHIGVGYVKIGNSTYWVQMFARM